MESGFRKLFSRRKGSSSSSQPSDSRRTTPAASPRVGTFPVRPFGSDEPKSRRTSRLADHRYDASEGQQTITKSRSKSLTPMGRKPDANGDNRSNSMNSRSPTFATYAPPVPKIPHSIYSVNAPPRPIPRHTNIIQAAGADTAKPFVDKSDPYNERIAERNSANNAEREKQFRHKSLSKYAEDVADRNIRSSESQRTSFETTKSSRDVSSKTSTIPPASRTIKPAATTKEASRRRNAYSSAQLYEPFPEYNEQPVPPRKLFSNPGSRSGSRPSSRPASRPTSRPASRAPTQREQSVPRNKQKDTGETAPISSTPRLSRPLARKEFIEKEPRMPSIQQVVTDSPSEDLAKTSISSHRRAQSSLTSIGSLPTSTISGAKHRRGGSSEFGSSDISDLGDLDFEIAEAVPRKADPVQMLRASIVAADDYIYRPGQLFVTTVKTTGQSLRESSPQSGRGTPSSRRPNESEDTAQAINQRAADALKKMQAGDSNSTNTPRTNSLTNLPGGRPSFDLSAEFEKLNTTHAANIPETEAIDQNPSVEPAVASNANENGIFRRAMTTPATIIRDFAFGARSRKNSVSNTTPSAQQQTASDQAQESDSDEDSAMPPSISRHRGLSSSGHSRASARQSWDFTNQSRKGMSRDASPTRSQSGAPTKSHTLRATIDDPVEASASDNGYKVEDIEQKRSRSLTLEAMARAPLDTLSENPPLGQTEFDRLKEQLAKMKPTRPNSRSNSIVSDRVTAPTVTRAVGRAQGPQRQPTPLRQYQHQPSKRLEDDEEEDKGSDTSSRPSLERGRDPIPSPARLDPNYIANPATIPPRSPNRPFKPMLLSPFQIPGKGKQPDLSKRRSRSLTRTADTFEPPQPAKDRFHSVGPSHSRHNSIRSTMSAGPSTSGPYHPVPPRHSSLKSQAFHRYQGGYFGSDVIKRALERSKWSKSGIGRGIDEEDEDLDDLAMPPRPFGAHAMDGPDDLRSWHGEKDVYSVSRFRPRQQPQDEFVVPTLGSRSMTGTDRLQEWRRGAGFGL